MEKKQLTQEQIERISAGAHVSYEAVLKLHAEYMCGDLETAAQIQDVAEAQGVTISTVDARILIEQFAAIATAK